MKGELTYHHNFTICILNRQVHLNVVVIEYPQLNGLFSEPFNIIIIISLLKTGQDEQTTTYPCFGHLVNRNRSPAHSLYYNSHLSFFLVLKYMNSKLIPEED